MFRNPFDVKQERAAHDMYWKSYLLGKRDGIFKRRNLLNARWPLPYRMGYGAGYMHGIRFNREN